MYMTKALQRFVCFSSVRLLDITLRKRMFLQGVSSFERLFWVYLCVCVIRGVWYFCIQDYTYQIQKVLHTPSKLLSLLVMGISSSAGVIVAYQWLSMTYATNYGFLIQLAMVFTVIFAHIWFDDEKLHRWKSVLVIIFMLGAFLIATQGQGMLLQQGDLLVVLWAWLFGIANIAIKDCVHRAISIPTMILGRYCITFLLTVVYIMIQGINLSRNILPYAVVSAFFLCFWLFALHKVIAYSSPSYFSMMSMINPVLFSIVAYMLFDERMSMIQIIGALLIIGSWIVLQLYQNKKMKDMRAS